MPLPKHHITLQSEAVCCSTVRTSSGLSLIELMIALGVAALLASLASPGFARFIAGQRATATMNDFAAAIAIARSTAIIRRSHVVLCPGTERCGRRNSWQDGALVFADDNRNGRRDADERLITRVPGFEHGSVRWRSFRNRTAIRFTPRGLTDWQNGHFVYCPANGDARAARMLIVNVAGRVRVARDKDHNGIREGADGRDLTC